jgi:flagellar protein FliS
MHGNYHRALQTYGQVTYDSAAEYASGADLLQLLFRGLTDALIDAQRHLQHKAFFEKGHCVSKAQKILLALRDTLDFNIGGDLARNLDDLYAYSLQRLSHAHAHNDAAALQEVHDILTALQQAWQQAAQRITPRA